MQIKPLEEIRGFLEKTATGMGIEIVDVEWNDKISALTVYIETETGVDLDTCENCQRPSKKSFERSRGEPPWAVKRQKVSGRHSYGFRREFRYVENAGRRSKIKP